MDGKNRGQGSSGEDNTESYDAPRGAARVCHNPSHLIRADVPGGVDPICMEYEFLRRIP